MLLIPCENWKTQFLIKVYRYPEVLFNPHVLAFSETNNSKEQKQLSRGVLIKRFSENIQQIYRSTPMPKLLSSFIEITLRHGCSPVNLMHIFRAPFLKNTFGRLLLKDIGTLPFITRMTVQC